MLLTVDIGNTRIKGAVFEDDRLVESYLFSKQDLKTSIEKILTNFKQDLDLIIASVGNLEKKDLAYLQSITKTHFVSHKDIFPFKNLYLTPDTLGIDRLILTSGAVLQYPNQNRLIIDVGTCVTYDFVDAENKYYGGAISPGFRLRYESLHRFTAKLPLLTLEKTENFIGVSTDTCIHSGVVNGLIHEINGFIDQYQEKYPVLTIILTGGDACFLAKKLKNTIFANPNFLLHSLNQFYHYKNKK